MKLQKGINLGGFLSQCEHNLNHYETFITKEDIDTIASWGMDHIRIPIDYEVIETEDGQMKKSGYEIITRVLDWAKEAGLEVILDIHKVAGYDFNNANEKEKNNLFEDEALQQRFIKLWETLAKQYGSYPFVAFELLNEVVEKNNADAWNQLIKRAVSAIRNITKDTMIIYGGIQWNSVKRLKDLEPPVDENIMFTFHYYEPLLFTHQKAPWVAAMNPNETIYYPYAMDWYREHSLALGEQGETVADSKSTTMGEEFHEELLQDAIAFCDKLGVRVYCGEFGVIDRAPVKDTLQWYKDITTVFHNHSIGYSMWNYKEKDFGIADFHYETIREDILHLV